MMSKCFCCSVQHFSQLVRMPLVKGDTQTTAVQLYSCTQISSRRGCRQALQFCYSFCTRVHSKLQCTTTTVLQDIAVSHTRQGGSHEGGSHEGGSHENSNLEPVFGTPTFAKMRVPFIEQSASSLTRQGDAGLSIL